MRNFSKQPLALALGTAFALAGAAPVFAATDLSSGYMVASLDDKAAEHKCGEAKCGADKKAAEAKCGADKKAAEAKCGADKKAAEHKCGEAKCGADKKKAAEPTK